MPIDLVAAGFDFRHPAAFAIDRPHGTGDALFAHFLTPIRLVDRDGERLAPAGTCILYPPGVPHRYGSGGGGAWANHWFHCDGPRLRRQLQGLGIPLHRALTTVPIATMAPFIAALVAERARQAPHWSEACRGLLLQALVALARASAVAAPSGVPPALAKRLRDLRLAVQGDLARRWTIADLARAAGVGRSRLAETWRIVHGASPIDDLIDGRIARARWLLRSTREPVAAVAAAVGFGDVHHFTRCFRARVGAPPAAWRAG